MKKIGALVNQAIPAQYTDGEFWHATFEVPEVTDGNYIVALGLVSFVPRINAEGVVPYTPIFSGVCTQSVWDDVIGSDNNGDIFVLCQRSVALEVWSPTVGIVNTDTSVMCVTSWGGKTIQIAGDNMPIPCNKPLVLWTYGGSCVGFDLEVDEFSRKVSLLYQRVSLSTQEQLDTMQSKYVGCVC